MNHYRIPNRVLELLIDGFVRDEARWLLKTLADRGGYRPGTPANPGDPVGIVLGWLWLHHPSWAMSFLGDYIVQLRTDNELVDPNGPPILLDDLLAGIRFTLPQWVDADQAIALVEEARRDTPVRLGALPQPPEVPASMPPPQGAWSHWRIP